MTEPIPALWGRQGRKGVSIVTVSQEEAARGKDMAHRIDNAWIADVVDKGRNGQALIDRAQALMSEYENRN